jgi:hypothetical protein
MHTSSQPRATASRRASRAATVALVALAALGGALVASSGYGHGHGMPIVVGAVAAALLARTSLTGLARMLPAAVREARDIPAHRTADPDPSITDAIEALTRDRGTAADVGRELRHR